jgi:cytohesin
MPKLAVTCAVLCAISSSLLAQDPNHPDKPALKLTADFWRAVKKGDVEKIKACLARDKRLAGVREAERGNTALHLAPNPEVVRALLDAGADLEALDTAHFATPLRWAAHDGRAAVAQELLKRGAKVDDIFLACALGDVDRVNAFLKTDAALRDKPALLCDLLGDGEHATEATRKEPGFATPLVIAVQSARLPVARALIAAGANVNAVGKDDVTVLHWAGWASTPEVITELVKAGASLDVEDTVHHNTPLGWAIVSGRPANVKVLIDAGAKIRPGFMHDAESGQLGDFKDFAKGKPNDYRQIIQLLRSAQGGATTKAS